MTAAPEQTNAEARAIDKVLRVMDGREFEAEDWPTFVECKAASAALAALVARAAELEAWWNAEKAEHSATILDLQRAEARADAAEEKLTAVEWFAEANEQRARAERAEAETQRLREALQTLEDPQRRLHIDQGRGVTAFVRAALRGGGPQDTPEPLDVFCDHGRESECPVHGDAEHRVKGGALGRSRGEATPDKADAE